MEAFVISTPILGKSIQYLCLIESNDSLLFANPVAVPRLPDAIYLIRLFSHGFKNPRLFAFGLASFRRLFLTTRSLRPSGRCGLSSPWNKEVSIIKTVWKTGNLNSRWSFMPPGWIRTRHIMASGRRGLSSPWNMEVSIIKVVWKTGNLNSRRSFKPPGWNQTQHIMASERREVK